MLESEESGMCDGQVMSQRCFPERLVLAKGLVEEEEVVCSGVELGGRGNRAGGTLGSGSVSDSCLFFRFKTVVGAAVGGKRFSESESESESELEEAEKSSSSSSSPISLLVSFNSGLFSLRSLELELRGDIALFFFFSVCPASLVMP